MKLKYTFLVCATLVFAGCKPKLDADTPEKGNVDATRYVAIGGSVTAGFSDGALYSDGQEASFVNMIAQQFKLIGGGDFNQPWMPAGSVGIGFTGKSRSVLGYKQDCLGATSLSPIPFDAAGGDMAALAANVYASGPFYNMGVPGAKTTELVYPGYGNPAGGPGTYNPFFARMASSTSTSVLQDAASANPTFFSVYTGEQDILNYALSGGTSGTMTPPNGAAGVGFDGTLKQIVTSLNVNGARGVIGNVPDVTLYPFFNTVPWNGLTLDAANAATLNTLYSQMGFTFSEGSNAFVIYDANAVLERRRIKQGELILLSIPLDSVKCKKMGTLIPIPDKYVLTLEEIASIKANIAAYNMSVADVAQTYGLAVADVKTLMEKIKTGTVYNGVSMNAAFVSGGTFSLDGLHLNPIGQAMLANVFIKSINRSFGSTVPQVDATKYRGVKFP